ncbi:MAG: hypothetical protein R3243_16110, partial [Arenibacter latericius]|nr:hypothetical protein [Arenibacter latericius]
LMILFVGYTVAVLFFAPTLPCSCGGIISLLSWEQHLVFNLVFLLLSIVGIIYSYHLKNTHITNQQENVRRNFDAQQSQGKDRKPI